MEQETRIALSICKDIETTCADIYFYYAEIFSDQPDVRNLWEKAAFEEKNHASLLAMAIKLKDMELVERKYDLAKFRNTMVFVHSFYEESRRKRPQLAEALFSSIELENKLREFHLECIVSFKNQSEEMLFAALLKGDQLHIAALERAYESVQRTGEIGLP